MRTKLAAALVVTLIGALSPLGAGMPARAATGTDVLDGDVGSVLPLHHFEDMVADHARDLAYVLGDDDLPRGQGAIASSQ